MKRFSLLAISFVFTVIFAGSAFAQTGAQPAATGRIGLVNTFAFLEDKAGAGITKLKNAMAVVDSEFKAVNDDLKTKGARYTTLATEIQNAQKQAQANAAVPIDPANIQAKIDEYQTLETTIKRIQEDAKAKYERRREQVVGPIYNDILKAMNDYARQKGYAIILDGARLEEAQILLGFDDKIDVTKDFIVFYNARPATTATTAVPK